MAVVVVLPPLVALERLPLVVLAALVWPERRGLLNSQVLLRLFFQFLLPSAVVAEEVSRLLPAAHQAVSAVSAAAVMVVEPEALPLTALPVHEVSPVSLIPVAAVAPVA